MNLTEHEIRRNKIVADRLLSSELAQTPTPGNIQSYCIKDDTIYLPVLKCASSWMTNVLTLTDAQPEHTRNAPTVVVITRDPIERWVTGMCTYARLMHTEGWSTNTTNPTLLLHELITLTEAVPFLDLHTLPQYVYTQHLDTRQILAFKLENLHSNMSEYLGIDIPEETYRNRTTEHSYTKWVRPVILKLQHHLRDSLDYHYAADYEYLRKLNYYNQ